MKTKLLFEDYAEAKKRAPHSLRTLWELDSVLQQGRTYLHAWEGIEQTTRGPDGKILVTAFRHFCVSGAALLIAASLDATKLLEKQKDSVHVTYFLNLVENEGKQVVAKHWPEVQKSILPDRDALEKLCSQAADLRRLRDERLAHLDRNILSKNLSDRAAADARMLRSLFGSVAKILRHYDALRNCFAYAPPPELVAVFPTLFAEKATDLDAIFGPEHLRDLLDLARLGWITLPETDPIVLRSTALHARLWRISKMINEPEDESNKPSPPYR